MTNIIDFIIFVICLLLLKENSKTEILTLTLSQNVNLMISVNFNKKVTVTYHN